MKSPVELSKVSTKILEVLHDYGNLDGVDKLVALKGAMSVLEMIQQQEMIATSLMNSLKGPHK